MRFLRLCVWFVVMGLLCTAAFVASPAQAKCASQAMWTWPPADVQLPPNGLIVLTGYYFDQGKVERIADLKPALTSQSGEVIPLQVVDVRVGSADYTKAMLRAERPLSPGGRYQLTFGEPTPSHWADEINEAHWDISAAPDITPPVWSAAPTSRAEDGERVRYGCGPAVHAKIQLPLEDAGTSTPFLVDVTLTDPSGGTERMWVEVSAQDKTLAVGHGMCGGDFSMKASTYQASLVAIDLAGNASPAPGNTLKIVTP